VLEGHCDRCLKETSYLARPGMKILLALVFSANTSRAKLLPGSSPGIVLGVGGLQLPYERYGRDEIIHRLFPILRAGASSFSRSPGPKAHANPQRRASHGVDAHFRGLSPHGSFSIETTSSFDQKNLMVTLTPNNPGF